MSKRNFIFNAILLNIYMMISVYRSHIIIFIKFLFVGFCGFMIEYLIILFGMILGFGPLLPRLVGFPLAVTCTWLANRSWSFKASGAPTVKEYLTYICGMTGGAILNIMTYIFLIILPLQYVNPIIALAFATIVSMIFNFSFSKFFVFRNGH